MPSSNLVQLLHSPGPELNTDLSVVVGRTTWPFPPLSWAMDAFFGGSEVEDNPLLAKIAVEDFRKAHDLVVNTVSMCLGAPRTEARYYFSQGSRTSHFNYFSNPQSRQKSWTARRQLDS